MSRENRKVNTMQDLQIIMQGMFSRINKDFFDNELEKVIITFEAGFKKGAYGWIHTVKDWKQGQTERYNINISADYLNRSREAVIATLMHEMCHLYALQNEIQDTSRSGIYHNKKFKKIAEEHGLDVAEADKIGWSVTTLKPETAEWLEKNCNFAKITIHKKQPLVADKIAKPKQSTRKYICPSCGLIVRATKECSIACVECSDIEHGIIQKMEYQA